MTHSRTWYRWALLAIVLVSLAFRVAYVLAAKPGDELKGDQFYYSIQARLIADGRGFEEPFNDGAEAADHPPMTVLVVALVSWGDSDPVMRQRLLMAFLGAGVVWLVGLLGMRVVGRRGGLIAAGLTGLYAAFWMNDGLVMSETLSALCIAGLLLAIYWYLERPGRRPSRARRAADRTDGPGPGRDAARHPAGPGADHAVPPVRRACQPGARAGATWAWPSASPSPRWRRGPSTTSAGSSGRCCCRPTRA